MKRRALTHARFATWAQPRSGCALVFALTFVPALVLAPKSFAQSEGDSEPGFTYRLTVEIGDSPGGEWTVMEGADIAIARWPAEEGGDVAMVAGPAVGGLPAQPLDEFGGMLSVLLDPPIDFGAGYRKGSQYGSGIALVDSVRLELEEGTAHVRIAGHDTRHHVLSAQVWWRHQAEDGTETPVVDTGAADLWFAPDLPFSWLPFAAHPASPGATLPLSFWWPEAAGAAVDRLGPRLEGLGLLLRGQVKDETRPEANPASAVQLGGIELTRSIRVADVGELGEAPDPEPFAGLPRIARSRADALQIAFFVLDPCRSLESSTQGSYRLAVSGPREYGSEGSAALFLTPDGIEDAYVVVTGDMREGGGECTLIMLPGGMPAPGTFPIVHSGPGLVEAGADSAIALHVSMDGQTLQRILLIERGRVEIDEADAGKVSGRLEGKAWGLEPSPGHPPELAEGLEVDMTFEATSATPSPAGDDGGSR
ncbi:MAG TPA: hypothetical protein VFP76_01015 [Gemmatimonadota bacterium]|nr:hypothetical protein [Gemmatimonadota bacterium]